MVATGIVATILCPLGSGKTQNKIHLVAAFFYMIDHHVMFYFLNTPMGYRIGFYACLILFGIAHEHAKKIERELGIRSLEASKDPESRMRKLERASEEKRREHF